MPPIEHELRSALQGRAATLTPLADPFPGVERRARGLRRRRAAASVAGTALAVLAVAGAVPLLTPDRSSAPAPGQLASAAPSAAASPAAEPFVLDPAAPWEYRGDVGLRAQQASLTEAWTARHPGTTSVVPLFGQLYEPSGQPEVVLLARGTDGDRWGVVTSSEAGWSIVVEQELAPGTKALVAPLAGDEGGRLLVVADPDVERLEYSGDTSVADPRFTALARLDDGVATGPLPAPRPDDGVRGVAGEVVLVATVPEGGAAQPGPAAEAPRNVVGWQPRGTVEADMVLAARRVYAGQRRTQEAEVQEKVLLAGDDGTGRRYLLGQFWLAGDARADTLAIVGDVDDLEVQLKEPLATSEADLLVLHLSPVGTQTAARLVVVTSPRVVSAGYSGSPVGPWTDDRTADDGTAEFRRDPAAERPDGPRDRLRVVFDDGSLGEYPVASLLCSPTSCS